MKHKNGGFFGIFKKKSTPAPVPVENQIDEESCIVVEKNKSMQGDENSNNVDDINKERKSSIAKTSVLHYSPPGSTIVTVTSSATTSTSGVSIRDDEMIKVVRKSNIFLDDEESVVSTPISQYDESEITFTQQQPQRRKKRAAPPPPPPVQTPSSPPPPPPPHGLKNDLEPEEQQDVEEMFQKLQRKFDTWHAIRLEEGGSLREETMKAEVMREHKQLRILLEKQDPEFTRLKIPQFNGANKPMRISPSSTSSTISPRSIDENRNVVPKTGNTEAVARLKKEVEQQRQREREVSEYRTLKSVAPKPKSSAPPPPQQPKQQLSPVSRSTPRIIEYHPMRNTVDKTDSSSDSEYSAPPPPIPNTPPPKLSDYRRKMTSPIEENKNKGIYQRINNNSSKPIVSQGYYVQSTIVKKLPSPVSVKKTIEAPTPEPIKIVKLPEPTVSPVTKTTSKEPIYRKINIPAPQPPKPIYQKASSNSINRKENEIIKKVSDYQKKVNSDRIYEKVNIQVATPVAKVTANPRPIAVVSETSIPYKKPVLKPTPVPKKEEFLISDILRAPKLRKVGMPQEKNGISVGKVIDTPPQQQSRPISAPPPPPPPPPPSQFITPPPPAPITKTMDSRDSLMHEIREAGRLRAARASQTA